MPRAAERLALNTATMALIAAVGALAVVALIAGRIFPAIRDPRP